jgi:putative ABC transport system ATP-binding protein
MSLIVEERVKKDCRMGDVTVSALKGLSFEIEPASFISFVGPSGSGTGDRVERASRLLRRAA